MCAYLVAFRMPKKGDRWCSKFVINFGQHYVLILADL